MFASNREFFSWSPILEIQNIILRRSIKNNQRRHFLEKMRAGAGKLQLPLLLGEYIDTRKAAFTGEKAGVIAHSLRL